MKIERDTMRCKVCRKRTAHTARVWPLQGIGPAAHHAVEYSCQECGRIEATQRYPHALTAFFSVPAMPPHG